MLFKEKIAVYAVHQTRPSNTKFIVTVAEVDGMCNSLWALRG
jgi:hypothetical protein